MTRTQELRTPITARKEGDWGRGTFGWIFPKNLLAEFDFLSVFTRVSSALLPAAVYLQTKPKVNFPGKL